MRTCGHSLAGDESPTVAWLWLSDRSLGLRGEDHVVDTCAVAEVVRTRLGPNVRLRTRRSLDERLLARWPGAWAPLARAGFLLSPRSRLRRALLRRSVVSGWSASARGDLDLMLVRCAPNCRFELGPELVAVGLRSSYRGHSGIREQEADWREAWEQMDVTPLEVLDAGNRLVILGHLHVRARGSGVELDSPVAESAWFERGLMVRECRFLDWEAALRAADIPITVLGSDLPPTLGSPG
jgi:hypothetical protein